MDKPNPPNHDKPRHAQPQVPGGGEPKPKPRPNPDEERSLPFLPIG